MKKFCLIFFIALFLITSIIFQKYSIDPQLFHIHSIKRGTLSSHLSTIPKSSQAFSFVIQKNPSSQSIKNFALLYKNSTILKSLNENFLSLLKCKGQIKGKGDSFYHINEQHQIICSKQYISQIKIDSKGNVIIKGNFYDCRQSQYQVRFFVQDDGNLGVSGRMLGSLYNKIIVYFQHNSQNNYFGLGQQFSYLNLGNNRPYSLFVRQKGVGRTDQPQTFVLNFIYGAGGSYYNSYSPSPIWFSTNSDRSPIAYYLHSLAYCIWMNNFIYIWDTDFKFTIIVNPSIKILIKQISRINGYTPPVPQWVNSGAIIGLQGGTQTVMRKYEVLKKAGAKISGIWLQDWVSKRKSLGFSRLWWNWELDEKHYPNWLQMKDQLATQGINLLIYINPMLTNIQKKPHYKTNFYKTALQNSHFISQKNAKIFQTSAFSDWSASLINFNTSLTNKFYKDILRSAIQSTGAKGLMVDFGQAYPVQNMDGNIEDVVKKHNGYPKLYQSVVREVLEEFQGVEIYTFSRAGYLEAPKYTLSLWAGDQSMNFKKHTGLPSCLTAMLSSSLIGYSNTHCDIGGYSSYQLPFQKTSVRTEILMSRWMQLAAFSPVFRTHQGNSPQQSLQVYSNQNISLQFAFYSKIFSSLSNYRKESAISSQKQGLPLIRPFFIENQQLSEAYKIDNQYYLGQDILVSPILTAKSERKYFVPKGEWINIWTNQKIEGCSCYKQSDSFLPPVLIKSSCTFNNQIISNIKQLIIQFSNKIPYLKKSTPLPKFTDQTL